MAIPDEDVAQVRTATDIVALIGEHAALKQQGRRWVGLCPFHAEKTPSFSVNAELGFYYCFGCQASGDAISFVRAVEHLDFVDAVRLLADRSGITLHEDAAAGLDRKRRGALLDAMEQAVDWYHHRLLSARDAGRARDYLRSRGYDGDMVRSFRLGWAPDEWDALSSALGLSERVLTDSGLGFVNRRGRRQDAFRGRVIFPICDPSGRPVALGGRILPGKADRDVSAGAGSAVVQRGPEPKYKNSPETPIYSKRRTLYALNWAKKDIIERGEVVVCEGYTDVIGFFQAGVPRAVATCGTALGEEHFTLLRNFGKRIVLAYDADRAGQSATTRVYEWERRHEVDVAVAALPPGKDPGDLAGEDPPALARAVAEAKPFLQFRVDRLMADADLASAEGRARAAEAALGAVAEHPDELVRDQYVMQIADRCRLDHDLVRSSLEAARRRTPPHERGRRGSTPGHGGGAARGLLGGDGDRGGGEDRDPTRPPSPRRDPTSRPGLEALRLAVHRPEAVVDRLEEVLFADERHRQAVRALLDADNLQQAIENASPPVADLLRRIAVEEPLAGDVTLGDPVDSVINQLVRETIRRALVDVQAEARSAPDELAEMSAQAARIRLLLEELDNPARSRAATDTLVAWLVAKEREVR